MQLPDQVHDTAKYSSYYLVYRFVSRHGLTSFELRIHYLNPNSPKIIHFRYDLRTEGNCTPLIDGMFACSGAGALHKWKQWRRKMLRGCSKYQFLEGYFHCCVLLSISFNVLFSLLIFFLRLFNAFSCLMFICNIIFRWFWSLVRDYNPTKSLLKLFNSIVYIEKFCLFFILHLHLNSKCIVEMSEMLEEINFLLSYKINFG